MFATLVLDPATKLMTCVCVGAPAGAPLTFQLKRHGTIVDESKSSSTTHTWDLSTLKQGRGDLHAQVTAHLDNGDIMVESEWQYVPTDATRESYTEWLSHPPIKSDVGLPDLTAANKPFESIAFIRFNTTPDESSNRSVSLEPLAATVGASIFALAPDAGAPEERADSWMVEVDSAQIDPSGSYVFASAEPVELSVGGSVAFGSGIAYDSGLLRRGSNVANSLTPQIRSTSNDPRDAVARYTSLHCGDFSTVVWHPDGSAEFHTDYVGASAWFEYRSPRVRIVASSYLLATAIAAEISETLSLNLSTIEANFTSLTQAFQQPILDDLDLAGFSIIRPDTCLVILPSGDDKRERNQLGRDIASPERLTVARYNELIDQAASELAENCAAVANDPEISSIRCDISGGLDSRLMIAGFLAGSPANIAKVSLYTDAPEKAPSDGDQEIAALVAQATGLKFSDRPMTMIGPCTVQGLAKHQISATFGTYWHRGLSHLTQWDSTAVYVGGGGLDNFVRDYTSGSWKVVTKPAAGAEEVGVALAQQIFKWRGHASLKAAPAVGVSAIAAGWDDIPGDENDKAAQLMNFFRARFHGGGSIPSRLGALRITPGPTRPLYLLRLMAGRIFDGPRAQLEILHRLNPGLAAVPFLTPKYNETYSTMYGAARTDLTVNLDQLKTASASRRAGQTWVACSDCSHEQSETEDRQAATIELVHQALRQLGNDPQLRELMIPAYRFAHEHLGSSYPLAHSYGKTFANKVLHLYAAWKLTKLRTS